MKDVVVSVLAVVVVVVFLCMLLLWLVVVVLVVVLVVPELRIRTDSTRPRSTRTDSNRFDLILLEPTRLGPTPESSSRDVLGTSVSGDRARRHEAGVEDSNRLDPTRPQKAVRVTCLAPCPW